MSRFWNDGEYDGNEEFRRGAWQENSRRAFNSQRGLKALRELRDALAVLPQRRLLGGQFAEIWHEDDDTIKVGDVCAIGALAKFKGMEFSSYHGSEDFDGFETANIGQKLGMSYVMAYDIAYRNDEIYDSVGDSERWWLMYGWLTAKINGRELPTTYMRGEVTYA